MNTVIIGNGIISLSIAFRLAMRSSLDDTITIIGKNERIGSASLAAAAMLNSFAEIEIDSLATPIDRYKFKLSNQATKLWPEFLNLIASKITDRNLKVEILKKGTFIVNNTAADQLDDDNYNAILSALINYNEPFDQVSPQDIPNYYPGQRQRGIRALYLPNEGWINPRLLMTCLESALNNFPQITFIHKEVERLNRTGDKIESLILTDKTLVNGDNFVLATGATISDILRQSSLGIDVQRVFYGVGVSLEIKCKDFPHTNCIRTPNRGLACGVYSAPYFLDSELPTNHILIGASNFISPDPYYFGRLTSVTTLLNAAMEQINVNFYKADLIRINVGWRPTTQDTYPILGKTSLINLVVASGTKRDGLHMAPIISEKIVSLLCNEAIDQDFIFFHPERKPIRNLTREQAINKAVKHHMSAAYQHGFNPSNQGMTKQMTQLYQDELERLHDQVGALEWGIPTEMLDMYRYGHAK